MSPRGPASVEITPKVEVAVRRDACAMGSARFSLFFVLAWTLTGSQRKDRWEPSWQDIVTVVP